MSEARSRKFFYNTVFTALLQVVTIVSTFILPRFMLKYYGSEINGLVTSITQFVAYFNLVEAGLSAAAIYALYKPLADKDNGRISEIVSASKKFYLQADAASKIFRSYKMKESNLEFVTEVIQISS